jgi:hypothetical protein
MMLICAVLASLATGVLLAHWLCIALFAMFRTHARQLAPGLTPAKPQKVQLEALGN